MGLSWRYNRKVDGKEVESQIADGALSPPKRLTPTATKLGQTPNYFEVFRYNEAHIRQLLRLADGPVLTPTRFKPDAVRVTADRYQIDPWWELLAPPPLLRSSIGYVFRVDGTGEVSPTVFSCRRGRGIVKRALSLGLKGGVPGVSVDGKYEKGVEFEKQWAVDPDVEISLITGQELAEHTISLLRDTLKTDPDDEIDLDRRLPDLQNQLRFLYEPPWSWSLSPPSETVHGDEGATTSTPIDLDLPGAGEGYFAVLSHDPDSPEDDEVSEIFSLEVVESDEGFTLNVITDFDGVELRLPEIA